MEKFFALAIVVLAILPADAKEAVLTCDTCSNCKNPQPRSSITINFDSATVTMSFSPQNITTYRATITQDFVEWNMAGGWIMRLNRVTGDTYMYHPNKPTPSVGHCSVSGPRIGD